MLLCAMIDVSRVTLTVQIAQMAAYERDEIRRACQAKKYSLKNGTPAGTHECSYVVRDRD